MPLLNSPIDGSPMQQIHRYGIEIDVCPTSGGIWLDKGELEKLMHFLREETMQEQSAIQSNQRYASYGHDDHNAHAKHGYNKKYKKKSKINEIIDLFDF